MIGSESLVEQIKSGFHEVEEAVQRSIELHQSGDKYSAIEEIGYAVATVVIMGADLSRLKEIAPYEKNKIRTARSYVKKAQDLVNGVTNNMWEIALKDGSGK